MRNNTEHRMSYQTTLSNELVILLNEENSKNV